MKLAGSPLMTTGKLIISFLGARGGETIIENGQALCFACNRKKGAKMNNPEINRWADGTETLNYQDTIILRQPQEEIRTAFLKVIAEADPNGKPPVMVDKLACGIGKTLAALDCANLAYRMGLANGVIFLTPRRALCQQYETAWNYSGFDTSQGDPYTDFSQFYVPSKMGSIRARANRNPVLFPDNGGYSITYASLVSDYKKARRQQVHFSETGIVGRKFILVLDEAQCLGFVSEDEADYYNQSQAKAYTTAVEALYNHPNCKAVILMTATDVRSDNLPLFLGNYSEPDDKGRRQLIPHVSYSYIDGVSLKILRPFEFQLEGVKLEVEDLNGDARTEIYDSRQRAKKLELMLRQPEVYEMLSDKFIERLLWIRETYWDQYKGMIIAMDINHAGDIAKYFNKTNSSLKVITVVGDLDKLGDEGGEELGNTSKDLQAWRNGDFDILLNVRKAYIGFDDPLITLVGVFTNWRHFSFLEQSCGRGGRVHSAQPYEEQILWVIGLNDPLMRKFAEYMRKATVGYLREKGRWPPPPPPSQQPIQVVKSVEFTGGIGLGVLEEGDLKEEFYQPMSDLLKENNIAGGETAVTAVIVRSGGSPEILFGGGSPPESKVIDIVRTEAEIRSSISKNIKSLAGYIGQREGTNWEKERNNLYTEFFPGGIANYWRQFRWKPESDYLADLAKVDALLESRIEWEKSNYGD